MERLSGAHADHQASSLAIRSAGRIDLIPVRDIAYIKADGSYSELILRDGRVRVHSKSLDKLLTILPPTFERIHRSYLVRLDEVTQLRVREGSRYTILLKSGEEIPVGRTRIQAIRARLNLF